MNTQGINEVHGGVCVEGGGGGSIIPDSPRWSHTRDAFR